jgi:hypothetical protein
LTYIQHAIQTEPKRLQEAEPLHDSIITAAGQQSTAAPEKTTGPTVITTLTTDGKNGGAGNPRRSRPHKDGDVRQHVGGGNESSGDSDEHEEGDEESSSDEGEGEEGEEEGGGEGQDNIDDEEEDGISEEKEDSSREGATSSDSFEEGSTSASASAVSASDSALPADAEEDHQLLTQMLKVKHCQLCVIRLKCLL